MAIPYVTFMKHAEKVTKNVSASRPVLQGVLHKETCELIVTDSHRLYVATNSYSGETKLIEPKTGANIDGTYPEVSRLIPDESNAKLTFEISNAPGVLKALKALQQVAMIPKANGEKPLKKTEATFLFNNDDETVYIGATEGIAATYRIDYSIINKSDDIADLTLNAEYIVQAIEMFNDVGFHDVTFRFYGNMRPITLSKGDLTALILPIRKAY